MYNFEGGLKGGPMKPRPPPFVLEFFSFVNVRRMVLRALLLKYIFSLTNIVNNLKKRICVRSLHFQSQMTKAIRIHAVNISLKQTDLTIFQGDKAAPLPGVCALAAIASATASMKC